MLSELRQVTLAMAASHSPLKARIIIRKVRVSSFRPSAREPLTIHSLGIETALLSLIIAF